MKKLFLILSLLFLSSSVFSQNKLIRLIKNDKPKVAKLVVYDSLESEIKIGTCFFIDSTGILLANYHELTGAFSAEVFLEDSSSYMVNNIIAWDEESDIIEFSIANILHKNFPYFKINFNIAKQGQKIFTIGSPDEIDESAFDGIISNIRSFNSSADAYQITIPVTMGLSGAPIIDMKNRVIGIVTSFRPEQRIISEGFQSILYTKGANINSGITIKAMYTMVPIGKLTFPK